MFQRGLRRVPRKESDVKLAVIKGRRFQKRIAHDDFLHFFRGFQKDGNQKAKIVRDFPLNFPGQAGDRITDGRENDVATLDVSFDVAESKRGERRAKLLHLDDFVSANVDSAQHRDIVRHNEMSHTRTMILFCKPGNLKPKKRFSTTLAGDKNSGYETE